VARLHEGRIAWILDITGLSAILWIGGFLLVMVALSMPRGSGAMTFLLWAGAVLFAAAFVESVVATFQSRFLPLPRRGRVRDGDEEVQRQD